MAKWFGKIGYAVTSETRPGIWEEVIVERNYYGDMTRNSRRLQAASQVNDDININNELSIISDPYAMNSFYAMRYAEFMGTKWKITNVEVQYPRLILSLGGLYNGE